MAKRAKGIKHIKGDVWLIDFQVGKQRRQQRIKAQTLTEAKIKRQEAIVELRKLSPYSRIAKERLNADISDAWKKLEADIISDALCKKNILRHRKTFFRLFERFREAKYPYIKSIGQISLTYLQEYKAYFVNELNHDARGGWRAELTCIKSMFNRLKRLGFCSRELIESLSEIKKPTRAKKNYPDIPLNKMKAMMDYIKSDRPDFYNILYYLSRVGRRVGETILIERKDVEWKGISPVRINIRPETTKMKKAAPLEIMDDDLKRVITNAYRIGSKTKTIYLFCTYQGKKYAQRTLLRYLKQVSEQILGVKITPHYFRHRFLTECAKAQLSMVDVMKIAGIRDMTVVKNYYQHSTLEGQKKVFTVTKL